MAENNRYTVEQFRKGEHLKQSAPKRSKYNAKKTFSDGKKFDSKGEAERYNELMLLHSVGEISLPMLQYRFLLPGGVYYIADFVYFDYKLKKFIVEDFKGVRTATFRNKAKQMKSVHGITILQTTKKKKK